MPIVAVSAAVSHEQYGINDRYKNMMHVHTYSVTANLLNTIYTGVGSLKKMVLFGHSLVLCY